jgi:adenine deaminase
VAERLDGLIASARTLGCHLRDPFMSLSFLALPVIPELKITDRGLVDVTAFKQVPPFIED